MENQPLTPEQKADVEKNKDVAAMSYLWIISVVVLYARRDSPFVQYHAKQGLWLFVLSIPLWLIPGIGRYLEFFILAGMIIGFLNAAQGKMHDVPIIGQLAKGTLTLSDIWKKCVGAVKHALGVLKKGVKPDKTNKSVMLSGAQAPDLSAVAPERSVGAKADKGAQREVEASRRDNNYQS